MWDSNSALFFFCNKGDTPVAIKEASFFSFRYTFLMSSSLCRISSWLSNTMRWTRDRKNTGHVNIRLNLNTQIHHQNLREHSEHGVHLTSRNTQTWATLVQRQTMKVLNLFTALRHLCLWRHAKDKRSSVTKPTARHWKTLKLHFLTTSQQFLRTTNFHTLRKH